MSGDCCKGINKHRAYINKILTVKLINSKIQLSESSFDHRYGGPGSQRVQNRHPLFSSNVRFNMHLASTYKYVIASLDGRGTMARGEKFKFELYRKMGTVEVEDQLTAATYINYHIIIIVLIGL